MPNYSSRWCHEPLGDIFHGALTRPLELRKTGCVFVGKDTYYLSVTDSARRTNTAATLSRRPVSSGYRSCTVPRELRDLEVMQSATDFSYCSQYRRDVP